MALTVDQGLCGEIVDVVNRAQERKAGTGIADAGCRAGRDAILAVNDVEVVRHLAQSCGHRIDPAEHPLFQAVLPGRRFDDPHRDADVPEESGAGLAHGDDGDSGACRLQGLGKFERMHDAAARLHRIGGQGDTRA